MFGYGKRLQNRLRSAVLWTKAIGYFRSGGSQEAIDSIMEMERISPLKPHAFAYLGQIYVHEGQSKTAKPYFVRAAESTSEKKNCYEQYVNEYSSIYIEIMETQDIPQQRIDAARKIQCGPSLKRWLPLSKEDLAFSARHFFRLS